MRYTLWVLCSLFLSVVGVPCLAAADVLPPPQSNQITPLSQPQWRPSEEQKQEAAKATQEYFSAIDKADFAAAYEMMAEVFQRAVSKEKYIGKKEALQNLLGALTERKIIRMVWVAPSKNVGFPGVYVGVEVTAGFANAAHYCGHIVLYQAPPEKAFKVMREEINFIEDRMVQEISNSKSPEEFDKIWAEMSARCVLEVKSDSGQ